MVKLWFLFYYLYYDIRDFKKICVYIILVVLYFKMILKSLLHLPTAYLVKIILNKPYAQKLF